MFTEIFNIILILATVFCLSLIIDDLIFIWQNVLLKEEKSTPIYIIKEIKEN